MAHRGYELSWLRKAMCQGDCDQADLTRMWKKLIADHWGHRSESLASPGQSNFLLNE